MISHKENALVSRAATAASSVQQKWNGELLEGVALIRISMSPVKVAGEFYAVFIGGQMSPRRFSSWGEAMRYWREGSAVEVAS